MLGISKRFQGGSYNLFVVAISITFSLMYNVPYYMTVLKGVNVSVVVLAVCFSAFQCALIWYVLALNRIVFIITGFITFILAAGFTWYMAMYNVRISVGLIRVLMVADPREVTGLLDMRAVVWCGLSGLIFLFFVFWRYSIKTDRWFKTFATVAVLVILVFLSKLFEPKAVGINTSMPAAIYEHIYHYALESARVNKLLKNKLQIVNEADFSLGNASEELTVVLMIGESMRGDHLQINGYDRPTSPNIIGSAPVSFSNALSCMTLTSHSIACMFTRATESTWERSLKETTFISVFDKLSFFTYWISNQGRLGHDTWVGSVAKESKSIFFCDDNKAVGTPSLDSCMLPAIDEALANPGRRLINIHMYGSHMRYDDRYTKEFEIFTPVCDKNEAFAKCEGDKLVNAYDNSILYSDNFYGEVIERLKDKNAILFFLSDHGEPLGENGIRARGELDVKESRNIAFIVWMSDKFKAERPETAAILEGNRHRAVSHNNLIYSIMDCAGIRSDFIEDNLSLCNPGLTPHIDPFVK